ncbi:unnamed protein product [Leptidea sinapis]|uniref:Protein quiver n=1 Tax=Leptidea sinapis TaxID=189913 RepID=A0A5E4PN45_9NEOP|nr:unnamed protein product [Leptidea sinapis]
MLTKIFIVILVLGRGDLRCYACGFSASDSDRSCLEITNNTQVVNCRFQYCTIMRQEFLVGNGIESVTGSNLSPRPNNRTENLLDSKSKAINSPGVYNKQDK